MTIKAAIAIAALAVAVCAVCAPVRVSAQPGGDQDLSAQRRTRIVIQPRSLQPGPNAKRYCRAWLAVENRPSGQVITPQRECWWQ